MENTCARRLAHPLRDLPLPAPPSRTLEGGAGSQFPGPSRGGQRSRSCRISKVRQWRWEGGFSTMQSELNDDHYRLLQEFNDLAQGGPTTDVAASDAARTAGVDPRSLEHVPATSA